MITNGNSNKNNNEKSGNSNNRTIILGIIAAVAFVCAILSFILF